jgi:hypothetical protein
MSSRILQIASRTPSTKPIVSKAPVIDALIVGAYRDATLTSFASALDKKFNLSLVSRLRDATAQSSTTATPKSSFFGEYDANSITPYGKTVTFYNVLDNVRKLIVVQLGETTNAVSQSLSSSSSSSSDNSDSSSAINDKFLASARVFCSRSSAHFDAELDRRQTLLDAIGGAVRVASADASPGFAGKPQIAVESFDAESGNGFETASEAGHLALYSFDKKSVLSESAFDPSHYVANLVPISDVQQLDSLRVDEQWPLTVGRFCFSFFLDCCYFDRWVRFVNRLPIRLFAVSIWRTPRISRGFGPTCLQIVSHRSSLLAQSRNSLLRL